MNKKLLIPLFIAGIALPLGLAKAADPVSALMFGEANSRSDYIAHASKVGAQLADEGFVLLKNDGFLPANPQTTKISIVGRSSVNLARGGAGSGSGSVASGVTSYDLQKSLTDAGYIINTQLTSFYNNNAGSGRTNGNNGWKGNSEVTIGETPMSSYTDAIKNSIDQYSDAIIQVITREGSEGCDVKTCNCHDSQKTHESNKAISDRHALQLSANEEALFNMIKEKTDHIIIVINSSNVFECDVFQKDPKVSAVLWIGNPGDVGPGAVGRILSGQVNPSGHTVDTWARDFTKDPTFQNFSDNSQTNLMKIGGEDYYVPQDTMFNADGTPVMSWGTDQNYNDHSKPRWDSARGGSEGKVVQGGLNGVKPSSYVSYEEGIYVDYRYYETRYDDMAAESETAADEWYDGAEGVVYPFGYGLSYTTFSQEIVSSNVADQTIEDQKGRVEVTVKVKNTGNVAGKEVVQLYWRAPYTPGGIEKASKVLCAFAKTDILQPNEEQELKLDFFLQDVANYDFSDANNNGFKGYELDEGDYEIVLGKNAHEVIDTISLTIPEGGFQYPIDRYTGYPVENRFTDNGFYNSLPGEDDFEFTQMSRENFATSFPTHPTIADRTLGANSRMEEFYTHEFTLADIDVDDSYEYMPEEAYKTYDDIQELGWTQAADEKGEVSIRFEEMINTEIDDPKWDDFMNQLTFDEMLKFVSGGSGHNPALNRFGKQGTGDSDGPQRFKIMWWVSGPIVAATYNIELARQQGDCVGMEGRIEGTQGWAGPGVNMHRSPFGGRNFEYYSADPFLTGRISGRVVAGASDRGVYCYFKHFAVNDQEKNREGVSAFLTEQALREIYLRPFQMDIQEGKAFGLMSSYNRLGLMETAASYPLLTEVLRNEWGFKGAIISDMTHHGNGSVNNGCYENINNRILAGCNQQLDGDSYREDMNAEWDPDAGCPVFSDGEYPVESYSWWYAVRKAAQEAIWQNARSSKYVNSFNTPINEIEISGTVNGIFTGRCGEDIDIEITLPEEIDQGGEYNGKFVDEAVVSIDPFTPLPKGLVFEDNHITGNTYVATNKFVHVLVTLTLDGEANPVVVGKSFELVILYEKEPEPEPEPDKPSKKKGCRGEFEISLISISVLGALAVGFFLIDKKRKADK